MKCALDTTIANKKNRVLRIYPSGLYPFPTYDAATFLDSIITIYCKFYIDGNRGNWDTGAWRTTPFTMKICGCHNKFTDSWMTCGSFELHTCPWY